MVSASDHSESSAEDGILKLVFGLAAVCFVIWLVFSVIIPLVIINLALVALVGGAFLKDWRKILFPLSVAGSVFIFVDYNKGWLTDVLVQNVSYFSGWIQPMLYVNLASGLLAAYLSICDFLNGRLPSPEGVSALSKRNVILASSLLALAGVIVGIQRYVDIRQKSLTSISPTPVSVNIRSTEAEAVSLNIVRVELVQSVQSGQPIAPSNSFAAPASPFIYVEYANGRVGVDKFSSVTLLNNSEQIHQCSEYAVQYKSGDYFCQLSNGPLNAGSYSVQLLLNGKLMDSYSFTVVATSANDTGTNRGGQYDPAQLRSEGRQPKASVIGKNGGVTCILPSGNEQFLSLEDCRDQAGLVDDQH